MADNKNRIVETDKEASKFISELGKAGQVRKSLFGNTDKILRRRDRNLASSEAGLLLGASRLDALAELSEGEMNRAIKKVSDEEAKVQKALATAYNAGNEEIQGAVEDYSRRLSELYWQSTQVSVGAGVGDEGKKLLTNKYIPTIDLLINSISKDPLFATERIKKLFQAPLLEYANKIKNQLESRLGLFSRLTSSAKSLIRSDVVAGVLAGGASNNALIALAAFAYRSRQKSNSYASRLGVDRQSINLRKTLLRRAQSKEERANNREDLSTASPTATPTPLLSGGMAGESAQKLLPSAPTSMMSRKPEQTQLTADTVLLKASKVTVIDMRSSAPLAQRLLPSAITPKLLPAMTATKISAISRLLPAATTLPDISISPIDGVASTPAASTPAASTPAASTPALKLLTAPPTPRLLPVASGGKPVEKILLHHTLLLEKIYGSLHSSLKLEQKQLDAQLIANEETALETTTTATADNQLRMSGMNIGELANGDTPANGSGIVDTIETAGDVLESYWLYRVLRRRLGLRRGAGAAGMMRWVPGGRALAGGLAAAYTVDRVLTGVVEDVVEDQSPTRSITSAAATAAGAWRGGHIGQAVVTALALPAAAAGLGPAAAALPWVGRLVGTAVGAGAAGAFTDSVYNFFGTNTRSTPPPQSGADNVAGTGDYSNLRMKRGDVIGGGDVKPGVLEFAGAVQAAVPGFHQFTAFNDNFHQGLSDPSKHKAGLALDFTVAGGKAAAPQAKLKVEELARNAGIKGVEVHDEYNNPSKNSTAGHIHVEFNDVSSLAALTQQPSPTQPPPLEPWSMPAWRQPRLEVPPAASLTPSTPEASGRVTVSKELSVNSQPGGNSTLNAFNLNNFNSATNTVFGGNGNAPIPSPVDRNIPGYL